jgi:hypothetical protein
MTKLTLTEPQEHHIETTLKLIDKAVQRAEYLFDRGSQHSGPAGVVPSLDDETLYVLRKVLQRLRNTAAEVYRRYGLHSRKLDLRHVLEAEMSSLWVMLEDCRPERMQGYGPMDERTARQLSADVAALLEIVRDARAVLHSPPSRPESG